MCIDDALHNGRRSTWQLLLQFVAAREPAGERETVRRVAEAVQGLGGLPPKVDQIGEALVQALRKAVGRAYPEQPDLPVAVRIWISNGYKRGRPRSGAEDRRGVRHAPGGWGFFIIQKREEDPQAGAQGAHHLIELYLYQEGERTCRDRRAPPA